MKMRQLQRGKRTIFRQGSFVTSVDFRHGCGSHLGLCVYSVVKRQSPEFENREKRQRPESLNSVHFRKVIQSKTMRSFVRVFRAGVTERGYSPAASASFPCSCSLSVVTNDVTPWLGVG